jgi:drug/metabolite transporter (DMT)-like permease
VSDQFRWRAVNVYCHPHSLKQPSSTLNLRNLNPDNKITPGIHRWFADGILLITALLWGTNIIVFKSTIGAFDPWVFNAIRLVFATLTLGLLVLLETIYWPANPQENRKRIPWFRVLIFCLLSGFIYLISFVRGIELTTAGNTALILASMPMWTAIVSYFALAERLPRITWMGLFVTFVGTIIVTTQSSGAVSFASKYFLGNLCMLGAALSWACGTVISRPILQTMSPLRLAFLSAVLTTPFHILLVIRELPGAMEATLQPKNLVAIIYSGVFSTGIAYATWHAGVRAVGGSHAAVYQNVVTLVAVVGGWIFLREQPMLAQLFGGGLTIAGLVLMRQGRGN